MDYDDFFSVMAGVAFGIIALCLVAFVVAILTLVF